MFRMQIAGVFTFLALAGASVSGCSSDNAASGPFFVGTGADGTSGDGGNLDDGNSGTDGDVTIVSGPDAKHGDAHASFDIGPKPDAITPDPDTATPMPDGGPFPGGSCAGICGKYVKGAPCHCDNQCAQYGDCCGDYNDLCVGPKPTKCGNGQCDPGETSANCAQDCKPDLGDVVACLKQKCTYEMEMCLSNKTCAQVIGCVAECKDEDCADDCTKGMDMQVAQKYLQPLGECGEKVGCVQGGNQSVCGDGQCEPPETDNSCPQDCKGPPPMAFCGDGLCNGGETSATCAKDCGTVIPPPGVIVQCLAGKCGDYYKACANNAGCQKVIECASQCADFSCMANCAQVTDIATQQKFVLPLGQCGQNAGCFDTNPPTKCGNGLCESGETGASCPQDCKTSNPIEQCLKEKCGKVWTPCAANAECYAAAQCLYKGGSLLQCVKSWQTGQMLNSVVTCGNQNKCLNVAPPVSSCQGKCGVYDPNAACQCDTVCKQMGNCCGDYATYCGTTPAKCGDGKCDVAAGEPKTCPTDCGPPPPAKCATKSDCAADEVCCAKPDGQLCVKLGQCN